MTFWSGSSVLVTGANGFTGSHLCRELLKEGARVRGLVRAGSRLDNLADIQNDLELVVGDVTDLSGLFSTLKGIDYLFHPAAMVTVADSIRAPDLMVRVNVMGAYHVAFAAMKSGVKKMLHISTCHVYGDQASYPTRETAPVRPIGIYAASKYAAEVLVQSTVIEGFPVVFSRAFAKFGPGQSTEFLIPNIISQLMRAGEVRLGNPSASRDYSYIVDIVHGYMKVLEKGRPGEIYHLGSGVERTVAELYDLIARLCGVQVRPIWNSVSRPLDTMRQAGDSTKARQELGWAPRVGFEKGLQLTIEWWRERLLERTLAEG